MEKHPAKGLFQIVHFGSGQSIPGTPHGPPVEAGEFHTVFELPEKRREGLKLPANVRIVYRAGIKTNLAESSVDRVNAFNVLSINNLTFGEKSSLLSEALRIIRPGKEAFFAETINPSLFTAEQFAALAKGLGAKATFIVRDPRPVAGGKKQVPRAKLSPEQQEQDQILLAHLGNTGRARFHGGHVAYAGPGYYLVKIIKAPARGA